MSIGSTINNNLAVQGNLDISGGIIYFSQQQLNSQQQFQNIQLNTPNQAYLSFPYFNPGDSTNAFNPNIFGLAPEGLGIIWDYLGPGETDLIGYGGAGENTGGISIYSYNAVNSSTHIANFWPTGSTIYTGLDISNNLNITQGYSLNVGSSTGGAATTNLYGNLNLLNNSSNNSIINFGGAGGGTINGSSYGLSITGSNQAQLYFPPNLSTNWTPNSGNTPLAIAGLGLSWNRIAGQGETDLICYGQGGVGGLSIYSLRTNPTYGSLNLIANFWPDGSTIYTVLDLSGNLIFTEPMNGIQLNKDISNTKILCFPSTTNAFNQWTNYGYIPYGLGITWSYQGYGETDLIGYGGGSPTSGGISIYSYNTNNSSDDNQTHIADFWPTGSTIYTGLNVGITNTASSTTNLWGNLNVRGLLSTQTYNASGGGINTNIGIYTYGASIPVGPVTITYGFNMILGSGILIVNTNNYYNSSAVWSFSVLNGGGVSILNLSETTNLLTLGGSSGQSPASIYIFINILTAYSGGNIYFTIIGNEPTGLLNLFSLF